MRRLLKWLRILVALVIIVFAVFINAARFTIPLLNSHRDFFEKWASRALHEPVTIGKITAGWYGLDPAFNFREVVITDPEKKHSLLRISHLSIGIDLWQSLLHGRLLPGHLLLSGTSFGVSETADGRWQLQGVSNLQAEKAEKTDLGEMKNIVIWMLTQSNISLKHININYHPAHGEPVIIEDLSLRVENGVIRHQIAGAAYLAQATPTSFRFVLNLKDPMSDQFPYNADLYVEANQVVLKQWLANPFIRHHVPHLQILHGQTNLQLWATWHQGELQSVQSVVEGQQISIKFANILLLNKVHANLYWQRFADGWGLSADQLQWQLNGKNWPEHTFGIRVIRKNPTDAPTVLVKTDYVPLAGINDLVTDTAYLLNLPGQGCKPGLCAWLRHAFLQGAMTDVRLILQGQGKFDFFAKLNHIDLRYSLHWPVLQDMQGVMTAQNNHLQIVTDHAKIVGNSFDRIQADITDLTTKPVLTIVGHSKTDLIDGMKFLHQSPLAVAKQMAGMDTAGPMDFNLKLVIPLNGKKNNVTSDGQITVHDGQLRLINWGLALSQVNGIFNFHNHDFTAKSVNAKLYGMPLTADITTVPLPHHQSMLQLSLGGTMTMSALQQQFNLPLLKYFQGNTHYHALLQVHGNDTVATQLTIVSDLMGLQSTLPAPYNKIANQSRALAVTMDLYNQQPSRIDMHYGDDFSAAVSVAKKNARWQLRSGEIHLGMGSAHFQSLPGLLITAKLNQVDGAAWKDHLLSYWQNPEAVSHQAWLQTLNIRAVELSIDQLHWNQYNLANTYLSVTPLNAGWALTVQNARIFGHLFIPHNHQQAWQGHFGRLYLLSGKNSESATSLDPHRLPPLQLSIDDFHYDKIAFGKVTLKTSSVPAGLQINAFNIVSPLANIQAVGTWQVINNKPQTTLYGQLISTELGTVLKNWQITQVLVGGEGDANFSLAWPGSPAQFKAAKVSGDIKFDFRHGRVTHLSQNAESELGLGRLLNLFSLQSIPLLPLNLVHLTQKGFAFSLFNGDFQLNNGNGTTTNTALVGPVAWVKINGRVGFSQKNYDLNIEVTPNMTSSLPLIVGIAGGPLAGAIAWVADKILAHQVGRAAKTNYRITGSWEKPSIMKLPAPADTQLDKMKT